MEWFSVRTNQAGKVVWFAPLKIPNSVARLEAVFVVSEAIIRWLTQGFNEFDPTESNTEFLFDSHEAIQQSYREFSSIDAVPPEELADMIGYWRQIDAQQ
jgi:hypothetical protein